MATQVDLYATITYDLAIYTSDMFMLLAMILLVLFKLKDCKSSVRMVISEFLLIIFRIHLFFFLLLADSPTLHVT